MEIVAVQTGGDVSKDHVVVCVTGRKPFTVANREEDLRVAAEGLPRPCLVHMERSGGYERLPARIFRKAGIDVRLHNPLKARRLAQAVGATAKTDPVDAKGLAQTGSLLPFFPEKSADRQALADLSRAIQSIKKTIGQYKKRRSMPELDADAKKGYDAVVDALTRQMRTLDKDFVKRVNASAWAERYRIIMSVPDVGPVTARIALCELPENVAHATEAQICSYGGLAPIDDSSGRHTGPARIGHGNMRLKGGMYMSAITAIGHQTWAKDLYARLRAKGRTHQQGIVAIMRRQLIRIVAVVKRGTVWQKEPPANAKCPKTVAVP
jgi:transposase